MHRSLEPLAWLIKYAQHRQNRTMEAALAHLGITLVQWNALREIARHPGSAMHGLAEATFNSDQAFGTLAARLARLGWVQRRTGAGRAVSHHLTPQGEAVLHAGYPAIHDASASLLARLDTAERAELERLLTKMLGADSPPREFEGHPPSRRALATTDT